MTPVFLEAQSRNLVLISLEIPVHTIFGEEGSTNMRQTVADLNNYCSVKPKSQETATQS